MATGLALPDTLLALDNDILTEWRNRNPSIQQEITAYIFPRLSQSERNKHWRDLFIAATALAHGHGVATRNKKDFELIATHLPPSHPLLRLAIWKP